MKEAVRQVAQLYLDALYHGDVELFRSVFHRDARLFSSSDGSMLALDLETYLAIVLGRPSPASRDDPRLDEILSIEISSPTTVHVRVRCAYLPKRFTDELTFVWLDGRWRLVAKVWHFEIEENNDTFKLTQTDNQKK